MAPSLYPLWKQSLEKGDANADLDNNTAQDGVYVALLTSGYVFSTGHQFYSSLAGFVVGTDQRIQNPVVSVQGVFDGDDVLFPALTGSTVAAFALYRKNSGASSTWRLVYFYDTVGGGLPFSPGSVDTTLHWNAAGIFRL